MQKMETKTESSKTETETTQHPQLLSTEKVVQETVLVEERHVMNVHACGDAAYAAGDDTGATAQAVSADTSSFKGKEGSALTQWAKEEKGEVTHKAVLEQEEMAVVSHEPEEEQSTTLHVSETLEQKPHFEVTGYSCYFSTKIYFSEFIFLPFPSAVDFSFFPTCIVIMGLHAVSVFGVTCKHT